jgi:hypothetical protein
MTRKTAKKHFRTNSCLQNVNKIHLETSLTFIINFFPFHRVQFQKLFVILPGLKTLSLSGSTKFRKSAETSSVAQNPVATGTPQRLNRLGLISPMFYEKLLHNVLHTKRKKTLMTRLSFDSFGIFTSKSCEKLTLGVSTVH